MTVSGPHLRAKEEWIFGSEIGYWRVHCFSGVMVAHVLSDDLLSDVVSNLEVMQVILSHVQGSKQFFLFCRLIKIQLLSAQQ